MPFVKLGTTKNHRAGARPYPWPTAAGIIGLGGHNLIMTQRALIFLLSSLAGAAALPLFYSFSYLLLSSFGIAALPVGVGLAYFCGWRARRAWSAGFLIGFSVCVIATMIPELPYLGARMVGSGCGTCAFSARASALVLLLAISVLMGQLRAVLGRKLPSADRGL